MNGDWDQAVVEFETALSGSTDPEVQQAALLGIGRARYMAGDAKGAIEALTSLTQKSPDQAQAYFYLGQAYASLERYAEAADAYLGYLTHRSGLVDAYVLELRGDALRAAGDLGGAINDYRAALESPSLLNSLLVEIKIAAAHSAAGDHETALAMYADIYQRAESDFTKAQMDLRMGQIYTLLGRTEEANTVYLDAVNNYPTAYDSYQALLALVDAGVTVDELNRGIVDYYAGQYGVAIAAFDRYLQTIPPDPGTAHYYNGLALRELGGFQDAIASWDTIIQNHGDHRFWDDAWEQKAYTQWAFQEQYNVGIQTLLDFVAAAPTHPRAGEFLFDAARVAERDGQLDRAAELWERVFSQYPGYEQSMRSLFLAGVSRYRVGNYSSALTTFQALLDNAVTLEERASAYFWQGKSLSAMEDMAGAQQAWEQAASTDPTGYYSERARDILRGRPPFDPPEAFDLSRDISSQRLEAEAWMRTAFSLPEGADLSSPGPLASDPRFLRGTELLALGLYDEARAEFEALRASIETDPVENYRLVNALLDLQLYRSAILTARQVLNLAGMSDAATMSAPDYFNHTRFGSYFSDLIIPQAEAYGFHPLFLFSVVRQESAFEGFVRSSAGARGLMQIVPATGQEIAASMGWPAGYSDEDLYRPVVSIALGTNYLAEWRDRMGGDLYAALAAYNGGPGNASVWQELAGGDLDLFVEIVRFDETRNYIRSIYEIFNIYRLLYDRSP
jgi:soluble lytic murein transglycosylase